MERRPPFTHPQFWTMSLESSQDQVDDDDDVLYFQSPDITDDDHVKPPTASLLQLGTLCTIAEFDLNLGLIAQQLEDSLDSKTLSYAPQYAVMDIPTDDAPPAIPRDDLQYDLTNPLVVDDYSVYSEQVNC